MESIQAERRAKTQLAAQVAELEARVNIDHTQREAELERLLAQASFCPYVLTAILDLLISLLTGNDE